MLNTVFRVFIVLLKMKIDNNFTLLTFHSVNCSVYVDVYNFRVDVAPPPVYSFTNTFCVDVVLVIISV